MLKNSIIGIGMERLPLQRRYHSNVQNIFCYWPVATIHNDYLNTYDPQGGYKKNLIISKSPLGDLGVANQREDFFNSPLG
jgi:hypothetical protein